MRTKPRLAWFVACFDPTGKKDPAVWYVHQTGMAPVMDRRKAIRRVKELLVDKDFNDEDFNPSEYCWGAVPYYGTDTSEKIMRRALIESGKASIPESLRRNSAKKVFDNIQNVLADHNFYLGYSLGQPGSRWTN